MKQATADFEPVTGVRLKPAAPKALRSLYGASDRQKATVKSLISPGERPQEIYTPESIVDAILAVWPHIALDPCYGPGSIVPASEAYYVPPRYEVTYKKNKTGAVTEKTVTVFKAAPGELDGLVEPWLDYTYCNPPFKHLAAWLKKACLEGANGEKEIMLLCPTRGNRKWFRAAKKKATKVLELDPLKFLGYASAFPAPLCIFYFGQAGAVFEQAFKHLGDCA
jgi:hypothetical protein